MRWIDSVSDNEVRAKINPLANLVLNHEHPELDGLKEKLFSKYRVVMKFNKYSDTTPLPNYITVSGRQLCWRQGKFKPVQYGKGVKKLKGRALPSGGSNSYPIPTFKQGYVVLEFICDGLPVWPNDYRYNVEILELEKIPQMPTFKLIIAGGREYDDYKGLCQVCDFMLKDKEDVEIVSGTARGADKLGERYAKDRGYNTVPFPAPWNDVEGKAPHEIGHHSDGTPYWLGAGHYRNEQMAEYADAAIVFWDGESKGARKMIELATVKDLKLKVVNYERTDTM